MFWGWDACLTANEETTGSEKTPGCAALIAMVVLVGSYLATGIAAQMAVGSGESGLGLANPETSDNVFAALAGPVMGPGLGVLLFLAVLASAAASLQTTFNLRSPARCSRCPRTRPCPPRLRQGPPPLQDPLPRHRHGGASAPASSTP
ncbi:hypothetical protein SCALM49S_05011 [Streptomyces californicus]